MDTITSAVAYLITKNFLKDKEKNTSFDYLNIFIDEWIEKDWNKTEKNITEEANKIYPITQKNPSQDDFLKILYKRFEYQQKREKQEEEKIILKYKLSQEKWQKIKNISLAKKRNEYETKYRELGAFKKRESIIKTVLAHFFATVVSFYILTALYNIVFGLLLIILNINSEIVYKILFDYGGIVYAPATSWISVKYSINNIIKDDYLFNYKKITIYSTIIVCLFFSYFLYPFKNALSNYTFLLSTAIFYFSSLKYMKNLASTQNK
ncbi:MAG: hypothetical protein WCO84_05080 [bacterium]